MAAGSHPLGFPGGARRRWVRGKEKERKVASVCTFRGVVVGSPEIHISSEPRGNHLRLLIKDSGIGIPHRYIDRIFKIFERLDPKQYPGTGIGLAIVQKSVSRMGGSVGVESVQGQGSTFWIELPLLS